MVHVYGDSNVIWLAHIQSIDEVHQVCQHIFMYQSTHQLILLSIAGRAVGIGQNKSLTGIHLLALRTEGGKAHI